MKGTKECTKCKQTQVFSVIYSGRVYLASSDTSTARGHKWWQRWDPRPPPSQQPGYGARRPLRGQRKRSRNEAKVQQLEPRAVRTSLESSPRPAAPLPEDQNEDHVRLVDNFHQLGQQPQPLPRGVQLPAGNWLGGEDGQSALHVPDYVHEHLARARPVSAKPAPTAQSAPVSAASWLICQKHRHPTTTKRWRRWKQRTRRKNWTSWRTTSWRSIREPRVRLLSMKQFQT